MSRLPRPGPPSANGSAAPHARPPRVYLAGPDVFRPAAERREAELKALCQRHGMTGVYPLDTIVRQGTRRRRQHAEAIYRANVDLLRSCDAILVDLSPFRGPSADPGTAFELGVAVERGLPCAAFGAAGPLIDRVTRSAGARDADGFEVEDFGLSDNLMLAVPCRDACYREPAAAVRALARALGISTDARRPSRPVAAKRPSK